MTRVAGIDIGTNSFLCLIADIASDKSFKVVSDEVEVVRLGQDVQATKKIQPAALERARKTLRRFKESIDQHKPQKILAVATSAARDAQNQNELLKLFSDFGIPLEIIEGTKEAELTFFGAISSATDDQLRAVIDIGGGSTEIIVGSKDRIIEGGSIDIGAVRITEMFFKNHPPPAEAAQAAALFIRQKAEPVIEKIRALSIDELLAVAGTPTELISAKIGGYDPQRIDGSILSLQDLQEWRKQLMAANIEQRVMTLNVSPGRADIILAGVLILEEILQLFHQQSYKVSTRGLRYGVCLEVLSR